MEDGKEARKAKASRIHQQIDRLRKQAEAPTDADGTAKSPLGGNRQEKPSTDKPRTPRDFIHKKMREFEKETSEDGSD